MQIRRFEAKTMTLALRMVKEALGPEAVILSARSLKKGSGVFGSAKNVGVEVTAATDTYYPSAGKAASLYAQEAAAKESPVGPLDMGKTKKKGMLQSFQGGLKGLAGRRRAVRPPVDNLSEIEDRWTLFFQHLLFQEIKHETAGQLIEAIKNMADPDDGIDEKSAQAHLAACIEEMGVVDDRALVADKSPKVLALTGPCGVGKTTAIAKLATQQAVDRKKNVALINLDNYRIGADEQLKVYARILGIPLATAGSPAEFKAVVKEFSKKDLILIDTPGINQKDSSQIKRLLEYFGTLKSIEVHLVLGAATKEKILMDTITRFKELSIQRLIFTRVDETRTFGSLLNLSLESKIPLTFLGTGQQIPEDLVVASAAKLADLILESAVLSGPAGNKRSLRMDSRPGAVSPRQDIKAYLVANKNSDVYHDPSCKWARKIKPENIIEFQSAAEAENQKFMPCRNCSAEQVEKIRNIPQTRDRVRISSYR